MAKSLASKSTLPSQLSLQTVGPEDQCRLLRKASLHTLQDHLRKPYRNVPARTLAPVKNDPLSKMLEQLSDQKNMKPRQMLLENQLDLYAQKVVCEELDTGESDLAILQAIDKTMGYVKD